MLTAQAKPLTSCLLRPAAPPTEAPPADATPTVTASLKRAMLEVN